MTLHTGHRLATFSRWNLLCHFKQGQDRKSMSSCLTSASAHRLIPCLSDTRHEELGSHQDVHHGNTAKQRMHYSLEALRYCRWWSGRSKRDDYQHTKRQIRNPILAQGIRGGSWPCPWSFVSACIWPVLRLCSFNDLWFIICQRTY
jgi:hypothetical protein